mgnify:CR=1 FL=1
MFYDQDFNGQYEKDNVSNKNVKLLLFLAPDLKESVRSISKELGVSMNEVIRRSIYYSIHFSKKEDL